MENFQLVPKEEEQRYFNKTLPLGQKYGETIVVPKFVEFPPLMKYMLVNELKARNIDIAEDEVKLPLLIKTSKVQNIIQK